MRHSIDLQAVLFDFDYTLADATEGNLECLNTALLAVGLPVPERAAGMAATGLSIRELLLRFHGGEVTEALHERFLLPNARGPRRHARVARVARATRVLAARRFPRAGAMAH